MPSCISVAVASVAGHAQPQHLADKGSLTMALSTLKRPASAQPRNPTPLPPPDFSKYIEDMPKLGRNLRVALPCVGIDGCGGSLHQGRVW